MIVRDPVAFEAFGCEVDKDERRTPDRLTPDISFVREGPREVDIVMPDGKTVTFWNFTDKNDDRSRDMWPSKPIRVRQGQIVHSKVDAKKNSHTIHHHGMNSSTMNDGVGHVSFEVTGEYTYQFRPHSAGTYFYHCHKNTALHFEMGMYGFLIIDPPEGPGRLHVGGPKYDVEALWAIDDVDPTWREMDHQAGLCGEDAGMDKFRPKYFMLSGIPNPATKTKSVIKAKVGQKILIRHRNASYSVVSQRIMGLDATIWSMDGRPLGLPSQPWCKPIQVPSGTPVETVTAQRRDMIVKATAPGIYPVIIEFRDWVSGLIQDEGRGVIETYIEVTA